MSNRVWIIFILVLSINPIISAGIMIEDALTSDSILDWSCTFGGTERDVFYAPLLTAGDNYALLGRTYSFGAGGSDYWLILTDLNGTMLWNQTYGGENEDYGESVIQTAENGFLLAGTTYSFGAGDSDYWLVKTDSNGSMLWNHTFGDQFEDYANVIVQLQDGSYLIAGTKGISESYLWLIKVNTNGTLLWNRSYLRENQRQYIHSMIQTADGGFLVVGRIFSQQIRSNIMLLKTDINGTMQWNQTIGDDDLDNVAYSIIQTMDGGFALAGETGLMGYGVSVMWLIKTDSTGTVLWNQTFKGKFTDQGVTLLQKTDGGFILAGNTESYGAGKFDIWVVETNSEGEKIREQTFGGTGDDQVISILQKDDGGLVIAGNTESYGAGDFDIWLFSTKPHWWLNRTMGIPGFTLLSVLIAVFLFLGFYHIKRR